MEEAGPNGRLIPTPTLLAKCITSKIFPGIVYVSRIAGVSWGFLTSHARALLCIAADPGVRLREVAAALGITERAAFGIVKDLVDGGYVEKERDGRRNRYRVRSERLLPEAGLGQRTVGHLVSLLSDTSDRS